MEDEQRTPPRGGNFFARIWATPMGRLLLLGGAAIAAFVLIQRFGQGVPATPGTGIAASGGGAGDGGIGQGPGVETIIAPGSGGTGRTVGPPGPPPAQGRRLPRPAGDPFGSGGGPQRKPPGGSQAPGIASIAHPIDGVAPSAETFHPLG